MSEESPDYRTELVRLIHAVLGGVEAVSEPIRPALTPEEWRVTFLQFHDDEGGYGALDAGEDYHIRAVEKGCFLDNQTRHALAALCLHGQPFGFRELDVHCLRFHAKMLRAATVSPSIQRNEEHKQADWMDSLADRIESLLPPEEL